MIVTRMGSGTDPSRVPSLAQAARPFTRLIE
jgi:hypothetical protein